MLLLFSSATNTHLQTAFQFITTQFYRCLLLNILLQVENLYWLYLCKRLKVVGMGLALNFFKSQVWMLSKDLYGTEAVCYPSIKFFVPKQTDFWDPKKNPASYFQCIKIFKCYQRQHTHTPMINKYFQLEIIFKLSDELTS